MPKAIKTSRSLVIPDNVTVTVEARKVDVKGPRGTLSRDFHHIEADIFLVPGSEAEDGKTRMVVEMFFAASKALASVRSICSHVSNMITGLTIGYEYKMRLVYAHFPINVSLEKGGTVVEIRNFLGEKRVRIIKAYPGVVVSRSSDVKDQYVLQGSDIDGVSCTASLINQACLVKKKDIRKFLDGIYISERGLIEQS